MKTAVVGGGILGLTLALRLRRLGHEVTLLESGDCLGGLAAPQNYGNFIWDRFYHCILPQDANMLRVVDELGLTGELRWTTTGTGYYAGGRSYSMSGNADFLKFPLLTLLDKVRMGAAILYATRVANPYSLYDITAKEWLTRICGRRNYQVFWEPLLRAKLGTHHDRVAAVFIWATLTRLFGARKGTANREKLGYVHGGYARILERFEEVLTSEGALVARKSRVTAAEAVPGAGAPTCRLTVEVEGGPPRTLELDQVFFTAPTHVARPILAPNLLGHLQKVESVYPTARAYLGVACCVLALKRPLTPYYVLNIGDPRVELTGLIEMTNLIDAREETSGASLVYLPRYLDSEDPLLAAPDAELYPGFLDRGLKRLFPGFSEQDIEYRGIHRARLVQPLPLVGQPGAPRDEALSVAGAPELERPFQLLGTYMLRCATLNNNEVVGLVDELLRKNEAALRVADGTAQRSSRKCLTGEA